MSSNFVKEKIQKEILTALSIAYPEPLEVRQYFDAFGDYDELLMVENIQALIDRGLINKRALNSAGEIKSVSLRQLILAVRFPSPPPFE